MIKVVALLLLGAAGLEQRQRVVGRLERDPASRALFARLAAGELVVMGLAIGVAVALARSAPPVPDTPLGLITPGADPDRVPAAAAAGRRPLVHRLADRPALALAGGARGRLVPLRRPPAGAARRPLAGAARGVLVRRAVVLVYATSGGPGVYGRVLFSAHMLEHMTMSMVVPPLLVLGAPVTLALRTTTARRDGTRGWREWLLVIVHSRFIQVVGPPAGRRRRSS